MAAPSCIRSPFHVVPFTLDGETPESHPQRPHPRALVEEDSTDA